MKALLATGIFLTAVLCLAAIPASASDPLKPRDMGLTEQPAIRKVIMLAFCYLPGVTLKGGNNNQKGCRRDGKHHLHMPDVFSIT